MDRITHRLLFSSLALIPALAALWAAITFESDRAANLLTVACSLVALGGAMTVPAEVPPDTRPRGVSALRRVPGDLPPADQQRATVERALQADPHHAAPLAPLSRDQATALVLRRCVTAWGKSTLPDLTATQMATLYLMTRLLAATPGEAGRLAQYFRRADAVLGLRDEVDAMARARAEWDRNHRLYLATQWLWTRQRHEKRVPTLTETLQALGPTDIDLWHRVVLEHDPVDPAQRAAALWCLRQPACDRATIAAYLAQSALDGRLIGAARAGNTEYLDAIRSIIERWNAGQYRTAELALDPPEALIHAAPRVAQTMQRLSLLTGTPWPEPKGAFIRYEGRPARMRRAWTLDSGKLKRDPLRDDYFDAPSERIAQPSLL